jgi:hypothetical protein
MNKSIDQLRVRWGDALLTALTLIVTLMLFVVAPLQAAGVVAFEVFGFGFALALAAGVFVMSGSRWVAFAMMMAIGMAAVAVIHRLLYQSRLDVYLMAGAWLIMALVLILTVARAVFAPGRITYHRIIGAILLYLLVAWLFVALFTFVDLANPGAFSGLSLIDNSALSEKLIYFSFVTLTTTGYGDIVPLHPVARSLCNVESIVGQLYPAILLARLVTLQLGSPE